MIVLPHLYPVLEDACFIVYEDEKEVIATNVSVCGLQGNHIKANQVQMKYSNGRVFILNTQIRMIKQTNADFPLFRVNIVNVVVVKQSNHEEDL